MGTIYIWSEFCPHRRSAPQRFLLKPSISFIFACTPLLGLVQMSTFSCQNWNQFLSRAGLNHCTSFFHASAIVSSFRDRKMSSVFVDSLRLVTHCVRPWKKLSSKYLNNFCKLFTLILIIFRHWTFHELNNVSDCQPELVYQKHRPAMTSLVWFLDRQQLHGQRLEILNCRSFSFLRILTGCRPFSHCVQYNWKERVRPNRPRGWCLADLRKATCLSVILRAQLLNGPRFRSSIRDTVADPNSKQSVTFSVYKQLAETWNLVSNWGVSLCYNYFHIQMPEGKVMIYHRCA